MINECNADLSHNDLIKQTIVLFTPRAEKIWTEFRLPNSYRADVLILTTAGDIIIIEAKPLIRPFELFEATAKYQSWANYLWIITNAGQHLAERMNVHGDLTSVYKTELGVIEVDRDTITWRRLPKYRKLTSYSAGQLMHTIISHEKTAGSQ